ncbi:MAG: response regulator transcription factor [Bacteroidota bacterium]
MLPTLLVIEDDIAMQRFLALYFADTYEVVVQETGEDALAWLADHTADAIVCDLQMPGIDGFEVVEELRSQVAYDAVPVVMLSGSEQSADRVRCLRLGADDFVVKPFNPEELRARLDNLLRRIHRTQRSFVESAA